jgi:hypothetical protein
VLALLAQQVRKVHKVSQEHLRHRELQGYKVLLELKEIKD